MITKNKVPKTPNARQTFTREEALEVLAESGIPAASPDDPIYKRPPSTIYTPPRGTSTNPSSTRAQDQEDGSA
jgi:hypothetical protein